MKSCPHLGSEVGIRLVLDALQRSTEPRATVNLAIERLRMELFDRAQKRKVYGPQ